MDAESFWRLFLSMHVTNSIGVVLVCCCDVDVRCVVERNQASVSATVLVILEYHVVYSVFCFSFLSSLCLSLFIPRELLTK